MPKRTRPTCRRIENRLDSSLLRYTPRLVTPFELLTLLPPRSKGTYLRAQYYRLKSKRGAKKAVVAVAASIVVAVFRMLSDGTTYSDLGPGHFNAIGKDRQIKRLVRRLTDLGCDVEIKKAA